MDKRLRPKGFGSGLNPESSQKNRSRFVEANAPNAHREGDFLTAATLDSEAILLYLTDAGRQSRSIPISI